VDLHAARKALTDVVVALLRDDPHGWSRGKYTIKHTSELEIWTRNGFWCLEVWRPARSQFGFIGKVRVWWAIGYADKVQKQSVLTGTELEEANMIKIRQLLVDWSDRKSPS
jgi:hypothetical protein